MIENKNKRIAINTLIVYIRMFVSIVVSLVATRYVLEALGQEKFGLFNVVGSTVTMLNIISVGMHATTRRFLNVEMGKLDGNLNKVFNISINIHIAFAISIFLISITVGLWYIYNVLNVSNVLLQDAKFVFFTTTIVTAIGIMNIPFQGLLSAYEDFATITKVEITSILLRLPLVFILFIWPNISLRLYASGLCVISLFSSCLYVIISLKKHRDVVKFRRYKDKDLYMSMFIFNNYTSLGAFAYISRSQGAKMIVNYFFGTIVNGAFAIVYQIEETLISFVNNLSVASDPQIIQSYSSGEKFRAFKMVNRISKYTMLVMLGLIFCIYIELEFIIESWLGEMPAGLMKPLVAILLSLLVRSINSSCGTLVQASGNLKYFEISNAFFLVLGIPISIFFFSLGYEPYFIIIIYTILDLLSRINYLILMKKYINFKILLYFKECIFPVLKVFIFLLLYIILYRYVDPFIGYTRIFGICISCFLFILSVYAIALNNEERESLRKLIFKNK